MGIRDLVEKIELDLLSGRYVKGTISCSDRLDGWHGRDLLLTYVFPQGSAKEHIHYDTDDETDTNETPIEIAKLYLQDYMQVETVICPLEKDENFEKVEIYLDIPESTERRMVQVDDGEHSDFYVER